MPVVRVLLLLVTMLALPAAAQLPESAGAPQVGEKAPDLTLPDTHGQPVALSEVLRPREEGEKPWVLLVFYRGYW
jgi:hypothetical protein